MTRDSVIQSFVTPEDKERAEELAEANGQSVSAFTSALLTKAMDQFQPPLFPTIVHFEAKLVEVGVARDPHEARDIIRQIRRLPM